MLYSPLGAGAVGVQPVINLLSNGMPTKLQLDASKQAAKIRLLDGDVPV